MKTYVLSVLGIVLIGLLIDIIMPSGSINKYIKSLYSIFVVAIIISPVLKLINSSKDFDVSYNKFEISRSFLNYYGTKQASAVQDEISMYLENEGFKNVKVKLGVIIVNDKTSFNSCQVDIKNLVISSDKRHIDKYEYIVEVVQKVTGLEKEVITFNE